jgi:hypothetical protein
VVLQERKDQHAEVPELSLLVRAVDDDDLGHVPVELLAQRQTSPRPLTRYCAGSRQDVSGAWLTDWRTRRRRHASSECGPTSAVLGDEREHVPGARIGWCGYCLGLDLVARMMGRGGQRGRMTPLGRRPWATGDQAGPATLRRPVPSRSAPEQPVAVRENPAAKTKRAHASTVCARARRP